jgi:hypothetical protein
MAQSIRISDDFYDLASHASQACGRSLAQQMEYWARLGAALDAAGLTSEQAGQILRGNLDLKSEVVRLLQRRSATESAVLPLPEHPQIRARHEAMTREVEQGKRPASSLFVIPDKLVRNAKISFPAEYEDSAGW